MRLLVGTSGWQYKDWRVAFYEGRPQRLWLAHYVTRFPTVEVNNAFYRLPERSTFERWREQTPEGFVVTVKVSRYLTHVKRLREPAEPVARLVDRAAGLGDRQGPFLLQLPPTLKVAPDLLDDCLAQFPGGARVAVELRHDSWWTDEVRAVLSRRGATLCWADRRSQPLTPLWATAAWGYLRLHEGTASPWPSYGRKALATWPDRLAEAWPGSDADVFVYFNNDQGAAAVRDAAALERLAERRGFEVARPAPRGRTESPAPSARAS
ncbi:MAG TPA: DUF72 domain-containing protein [Acidimicrobiales bacterium]|nr:DUF72 domain-containing protein [Acidimicrobiales bacterium]